MKWHRAVKRVRWTVGLLFIEAAPSIDSVAGARAAADAAEYVRAKVKLSMTAAASRCKL